MADTPMADDNTLHCLQLSELHDKPNKVEVEEEVRHTVNA